MSRPSLNDAVSSARGMSVASLDDDRGLSDIEVDAGAAAPQYTTLQTRAGVSATPNTARALGVASAVAARSMAEPQNSSKQGDATSADVVKAVIQGKLDGVFDGVFGGEPVSEKPHGKFAQFLLETTAVGVEKPVDGVNKAQQNKSAHPLTKVEEKREAAMRHIIQTGSFEARSAMGNLFRASLVPGSAHADAYSKCTTPTDQQKISMQWCKDQHAALASRRSLSRDVEWSKQDCARFRYRVFGSMVLERGGWGCNDAIKGAMAASAM
jgi:hypothetical protein